MNERCPSCLGRLRYVDTEQNGDTAYVCIKCGDEWYGSTLFGIEHDGHSESAESNEPTRPADAPVGPFSPGAV